MILPSAVSAFVSSCTRTRSLMVAAIVIVVFLVTYVISKLGGATRRTATPWLCGYVLEADCYRYTAHNFYGEIKRYFKWLGGMPKKHD